MGLRNREAPGDGAAGIDRWEVGSQSLTVKRMSKGQVTIPRALRDRFGLHALTEVTFEAAGEGVLIKPAATARRARLQTRLRRARGSATAGRTTREIMRLTRGEED